MLILKDLSVAFKKFQLKNISLDVKEGEYLVILGMSGVGKSVLLEIIAGLTSGNSGTVVLDNKDITHEKIQRRSIALVYQDQALFPHLTARQNVEYGLRSRRMAKADIRRKTDKIFDDIDIHHLADRFPITLSGGEAQRVALGRALVINPRILLLDEPLSALDVQSRGKMQSLLRKINKRNQTIIHVTHDYEEAISLADRIVIMENGAISQVGTPNEIFQHPKSQFVANFVGIRNFIKGELHPPESNTGKMSVFKYNGASVRILTDRSPGNGHITVHSEDIILSQTNVVTSAQNQYQGTIADIAPSRMGMEVTVDIGFKLTAIVTEKTVDMMNLEVGQGIYLSFKATACKYISG